MTVVCGDSHTLDARRKMNSPPLAHGIGTSEVEHVEHGDPVPGRRRSRRPCWSVEGQLLGAGVTAKDMALAVIGKIGTAGGTGYAIEFAGSAIRACRWKAA
jgi:3-isopropylmalate/(R)-2-methylmalate dehydratase large subunit